MQWMIFHGRWLGAALLLTLLVYGRLLPVYYCGYDDFTNANQAAFADARDPMRMLTTTHFDTPKYRPGSRLLTYLCHLLTPDSALAYRLRNLLFHLLAVAMVYGITVELGGAR